jgi:hypothetical protein
MRPPNPDEQWIDELDRLAKQGNLATARADDVAARFSLGLASDAEVRAALDVDPTNPCANTSGLVTQCMLMGRWDLFG